MKKMYTASEISELVCRAQGLELDSQTQIFNRVKYIAKRGQLCDASIIDKRGTLAFSKIEVFRAAILCELLGLAMDVRVLRAVLAAADSEHVYGNVQAPSQEVDGYIISHGGLKNAIFGIASGESWSLKIWLRNPGFTLPERIDAAFVWDGAPDQSNNDADADAILGRAPVRARVCLRLSDLFAPLIELVGLPDVPA